MSFGVFSLLSYIICVIVVKGDFVILAYGIVSLLVLYSLLHILYLWARAQSLAAMMNYLDEWNEIG